MDINYLVKMYKSSQNPNAIIEQNPQIKSMLSLYNGNAKECFYALCKQRNVDPNSILNLFK